MGRGALAEQDTQSRSERFLASGNESGTAPEDRPFRPDVEGLRAVAVLLVVLFHSGVSALSGGYIGVDVFFVISGFVITGVLLRERATSGRTSILAFYGRRCRRIIPAATLVIIITVFLSYHFLGIGAGDQTAIDGRWATVFLANFHFSQIGTNYLSAQQPPSPLQNYWSLSVEEQFYVVYPTFFLLLAAVGTRLSLRVRLAIGLVVVIGASLTFSIIDTQSNPTGAYFSPFTRAWELALGALVAVGTPWLKKLPSGVAAFATWLGFGAILVAALTFTTKTAYPGSLVAIPVVGAALIIAAGAKGAPLGAEALLGRAPFRGLGRLSYSLYLWHWPILIIAAEYSGKAEPVGPRQLGLGPRGAPCIGDHLRRGGEPCSSRQGPLPGAMGEHWSWSGPGGCDPRDHHTSDECGEWLRHSRRKSTVGCGSQRFGRFASDRAASGSRLQAHPRRTVESRASVVRRCWNALVEHRFPSCQRGV